MMLEVEHLSVRLGGAPILRDIGFTLGEGDWLMVVGPNGAGKTTLVRALSGGAPYTGRVLCLGRELSEYRPRELARRVGVLAQEHAVGYSFTVREVVRLGRYAYTRGVFRGRDPACEESVARALRLTELEALADRPVSRLSGGELQRMFLAQLFAQDPSILLLDEPSNHLDLVYQRQLMELVSAWLRRPGRAAVSVMHDLSLARAYGSRFLLLRGGETVACGAAEAVLSRENLARVYEMDVHQWMLTLLEPWR